MQEGAGGVEARWADIALELLVKRAEVAQVGVGARQRGIHREEDPLGLILGIGFSTFLRNQAEFSEALGKVRKAFFVTSDTF